jgi:hypothetical protein
MIEGQPGVVQLFDGKLKIGWKSFSKLQKPIQPKAWRKSDAHRMLGPGEPGLASLDSLLLHLHRKQKTTMCREKSMKQVHSALRLTLRCIYSGITDCGIPQKPAKT